MPNCFKDQRSANTACTSSLVMQDRVHVVCQTASKIRGALTQRVRLLLSCKTECMLYAIRGVREAGWISSFNLALGYKEVGVGDDSCNEGRMVVGLGCADSHT